MTTLTRHRLLDAVTVTPPPAAETITAALMPGERVHMRMAGGATPGALLAEAPRVGLVLDYSRILTAPEDPSVAFALRHGAATFLEMSEDAQGAGAALLVPASNGYIAFRTKCAAGCQVEPLRVGPGCGVMADRLVVQGAARVGGDAWISGNLYAEYYANLIDDFTDPTLLRPPTAGALNRAYIALSNQITEKAVALTAAAGPSCPYPPWAPFCCDSNPAEHAAHSEMLEVGPIAAADLVVLPGGSVTARSFCNLVHDVHDVSKGMPPSAYALNTAYVQLSNMVVMGLHSINAAMSVHDASMGGCCPTLGPTDAFTTATVRFPTDAWLQSADLRDRLLFAAGGASTFAAAASGGDHDRGDAGWCFRWVDATGTDGLVAGRDAAELMRLDASGRLRGLPGGLSVGGGVTVGADLLVGGAVSAAAYCNLPVATADGAPGLVALSSDFRVGAASSSNVAATPAAVAASYASLSNVQAEQALVLAQTEGLVGMAVATAEEARDFAVRAYDDLFAPFFMRSPAVPGEPFTGLVVGNAAGGPGSAAQIALSNAGGGALVLGLDAEEGGGASYVRTTRVRDPRNPLPPAEITLAAGGVPSCVLAVNSVVEVRPGQSAEEMPRDIESDVTQDGYAIAASSVFSADHWCQAHQGVSRYPEGAAWVSSTGRYDPATGKPLRGRAAETPIIDYHASPLLGEWLQIKARTPVFVHSILVRTAASPLVTTDGFILLGTSDPPESLSIRWEVICDPALTGAGQRNLLATHAGRNYAILKAAQKRAFSLFRLVVTSMHVDQAWAALSGGAGVPASVDVFKLIGSADGPAPDTLFRVDDQAFVVERGGNIGVGVALPSAPLQFANAPAGGRPRTLVLHDAAAEEGYAGLGVSAVPELLYRVPSAAGSAHVFVCGPDDAHTEIMRATADSGGRLAVKCRDPRFALDVGGDAGVRGSLDVASDTALHGALRIVPPGADAPSLAFLPDGSVQAPGLQVDGATGRLRVGLLLPVEENAVAIEVHRGTLCCGGFFRAAPASNVLSAASNVAATPLVAEGACELRGTLSVGPGVLTVPAGGSEVRVTAPLHADASLDVGADATVGGALAVGGAVDVGAGIDVAGTVRIGSNLVVASRADFRAGAGVTGGVLYCERLEAGGYIGLVDDYLGSLSSSNPPSARALYQACLDLSSDTLHVLQQATRAQSDAMSARGMSAEALQASQSAEAVSNDAAAAAATAVQTATFALEAARSAAEQVARVAADVRALVDSLQLAQAAAALGGT